VSNEINFNNIRPKVIAKNYLSRICALYSKFKITFNMHHHHCRCIFTPPQDYCSRKIMQIEKLNTDAKLFFRISYKHAQITSKCKKHLWDRIVACCGMYLWSKQGKVLNLNCWYKDQKNHLLT